MNWPAALADLTMSAGLTAILSGLITATDIPLTLFITFFIGLLYIYSYHFLKTQRTILGLLFGAMILLIVCTMIFTTVGIAVMSMFGFMLFFVRSYLSIGTTPDDTPSMRNLFIDLVLMIISLTIAFNANEYLALPATLFALVVLWRIAALRYADIYSLRKVTKQHIPSLFSFMFSLGLIITVVSVILVSMHQAIFTLFGKIIWPIVNIIGNAFFTLFDMLIAHLHNSNHHHHQKIASKGPSALEQLQKAHASAHVPWWLHQIFLLILACVIIYLFIILWRKLAIHQNINTDVVSPTIVRSKLPKKKMKTNVPPTPLRTLFKEWVHDIEQKGVLKTRHHLTARELFISSKAHEHDNSNSNERILPDVTETLITRYERERYGGDIASGQEVEDLRAALKLAKSLK